MTWTTVHQGGSVYRQRRVGNTVERELVEGPGTSIIRPGREFVERSVVAPPVEKIRFYPTLTAGEATISLEAADRIRNEIRRWHRGFEIGGCCFSDPRWPEHIVTSTEPGTDSIFTRTSGRLGQEVLRALEGELPAPRLHRLVAPAPERRRHPLAD